MKNLYCVVIFFFLFTQLPAQELNEYDALAREFIGFMENNQFNDAEEMFDERVKNQLSLQQLEDLWNDMLRKLGGYERIDQLEKEDVGGMVIVYAQTKFSSRPIIIQLAFNYDKKISGIYFKPVINETTYALPEYVNTDLYREEEMILEVPQGQLPATFTRPVFINKFPVVILIHGSGPHDRDEAIGPNKPFKDLAAGLASQGIATFRFEKKTKIYPQYFEEIKSTMTVKEEVLQDAASAVDVVKKIKGVNRRKIVILGHSLGGMLAPRIADENREVDAIIMMAGNASPLEDLILHQIEYLSSLDNVPDNRKESLTAIREQIEQLKNMDLTIGTPPDDLILHLPVSYWKDLAAYDQVQMAKDIKEPILILQGGRDYQVPVEEFERWQQALEDKKDVKFILYPFLNHIFVPGEGKSDPLEYEVTGHVPEEVVKDIAKWIKLEL